VDGDGNRLPGFELMPDGWEPPPIVAPEPEPVPDYESFFVSMREQWRQILNLTTAQSGDVSALQIWISRLPVDPAMVGVFIADWNTVVSALPAGHGIDFGGVVTAAEFYNVALFAMVDPTTGLLPTE
jgi:hypothetical protein